jgi:hypothetical protein
MIPFMIPLVGGNDSVLIEADVGWAADGGGSGAAM